MVVRLRYEWGQRSRARKWVALAFILIGFLFVGIAYVPDIWLAATGRVVSALPGAFAQVGVRSLALATTVLFLLIGLSVFAAARPRRHSYVVEQARLVAPVSVYLDAENQLRSADEVKHFMRLLREHLTGHQKSRRVDLIYYADARLAASTRAYVHLYRFGFRPIDVPHTPLGVDNTKNIVDVELALHAYQRAILGPQQQEVILVTADRDFLPLIYRLLALGHNVGIWASSVPQAFKDLQKYLDIHLVEFGSGARAKDDVHTSQGSDRQQSTNLHAVLPEDQARPRSSSASMEWNATLAQAASLTLEVIQAVSQADQTAEERFALVKQRLSSPGYDVAASLGYTTKQRTVMWLAHLRALGIVSGDSVKVPVNPEPLAVEDGLRLLEVFLRDLAETAERLAKTGRQRVRLTTLCRNAARSSAAAADDRLNGMRKHLRASLAGNPAYCMHEMQSLCRLARSAGVMEFEETSSPNVIILANSEVEKRSENAPGDETVDETVKVSSRPETEPADGIVQVTIAGIVREEDMSI